MTENCENCHSYKGNKKVFLSDGVCFVIPSKPKFVKKTDKCKYWRKKDERPK